jgi:acyl carrier protein
MHSREIREVIAKHARLSLDVGELSDDCDLYDAGLTSLTTVNLMLALEERFDVEFKDSMLQRKTFATIGALCRAIEELLAAEATRA